MRGRPTHALEPVFPALPKYLHRCGALVQESSPGLRFGPYFAHWRDPGLSLEGLKVQELKERKREALEDVGRISFASLELARALQARQRYLATGGQTLSWPTITVSPLVTGLGLEHAVENGFSFLTPYGLPYLPGSGIKGACRRAAEELCLAGELDFLTLWWLFGFESESAYLQGAEACPQEPAHGREMLAAYLEWAAAYEDRDGSLQDFFGAVATPALRRAWQGNLRGFLGDLPRRALRREIHFQGLLRFWDAYPVCTSLEVDILTPHYTHYYQGPQFESPHDSGQPIPSPFLVIPPGTPLDLVVSFEPTTGCPDHLAGEGWKGCLKRIMEETLFSGLGGKTAVGYGQLKVPGGS